jgi:hypothetical protein
MTVCLVWFSLMTREGEIGVKSNAPEDNSGPATFFTSCMPGTAEKAKHFMSRIVSINQQVPHLHSFFC